MPGPVLLLDCYTPPLTAVPQFARFFGGHDLRVLRAVDGCPPSVSPSWQAVIVTGSAASLVDREPWMEDTVRFMQDLLEADTPLLGCCFGHQLLAVAASDDWSAVYKRDTVELGYKRMVLTAGDPLFSVLGPEVNTFVSHEDEVRAHPAYEVLGRSEECPIHALRVPGKRAWSVQFHVEYTPEEELRILTYRAIKHAELGLDANAMFEQRHDSDALAQALFDRFLAIADEGR